MIDPVIETLIANVDRNPRAMLNLARTLLLPRGLHQRARELADAAVALAPDDQEVAALARPIRARGVRGWYFSNLQDHPRHRLYETAFRQVFTPGCTVLDIGAGTGFLAMLAIRCGAGHVIACERDENVAALARQVIAANGLSDRITIVAKASNALEIGVDLDAPVDILLWDNLANNLLGGGAADAVEDARRRLVRPGAPVIPARGELRVCLIEDLAPADTMMDQVSGFDLTPFNTARPAIFTMANEATRRASDGVTIFDIDLASAEPLAPQRAVVAVTATGGPVHGVAQWIRFHLAPGVIYDTFEDSGVRAFGVLFHAIDPFEAAPGQSVEIAGAHDRKDSWFWIAAA